jgi:hypothetical protein
MTIRDNGDARGIAYSECGSFTPSPELTEGTRPDMQKWIEHYGGYRNIDWSARDRAVARWQEDRRWRLASEQMQAQLRDPVAARHTGSGSREPGAASRDHAPRSDKGRVARHIRYAA